MAWHESLHQPHRPEAPPQAPVRRRKRRPLSCGRLQRPASVAFGCQVVDPCLRARLRGGGSDGRRGPRSGAAWSYLCCQGGCSLCSCWSCLKFVSVLSPCIRWLNSRSVNNCVLLQPATLLTSPLVTASQRAHPSSSQTAQAEMPVRLTCHQHRRSEQLPLTCYRPSPTSGRPTCLPCCKAGAVPLC